MPPNRKVVLKRGRRPGRKALLTFAGLFTVIRLEQLSAERPPANEVGRVVRPSGSPPARQRGYARRGRICATWPKIGRAHVLTPVTPSNLVCRLLLEKKNTPPPIKLKFLGFASKPGEPKRIFL